VNTPNATSPGARAFYTADTAVASSRSRGPELNNQPLPARVRRAAAGRAVPQDAWEPKVFEPNHERYKKSTKAEKRVAERVGARTQPRSGGLAWSRADGTTAEGDMTSADLHIEHKRVEPQTKSIGIKREWLAKVTGGAKRRNRVPAMAVTFEEAEGHEQDWLMLPLEFAERLLKLLEEDA